MEVEHPFRTYFPDAYYAVAVPLFLLISVCSLACGAIGYYILQSDRPYVDRPYVDGTCKPSLR